MEAINAKIASLSIAKMQEIATMLSNDFQDGADIVLDAIMGQLEAIMPETDFVAFCDAL